MEFTYCKLIDVLSNIHSGGTPSTRESSYWGGKIKWLSSGETSQRFISDTIDKITDEGVKNSSTKLASKGSIVMACAGQGKTRGQTSYLLDDMYINQSVIALETNESVLPLYLFYDLSSRYEELRGGSDASITRGSITTTSLKNLSFKYPDLSTQQSIVDILWGYDSLIEANNRRIELLEQAAQELYKEWFVRFRFPGHEAAKFENGLPSEWERKQLGDMIAFNPTITAKGATGFRSIPMAALSTNNMVIDESLITSTDALSGSRSQNLDTLLARITPCLENGKTGFVFGLKEHEVAGGSTEFIVMRSKSLTPYFVYFLARSDTFREYAISSMNGADGRQRAKVDRLEKLWWLQPPQKRLEQFDSKVKGSFELIHALTYQNQNLAAQRDMLLPRLMSGKLEV